MPAFSVTVASIPIPGWRSLRPVKNRGGSFVKGEDQNFTPIFSLRNLQIWNRNRAQLSVPTFGLKYPLSFWAFFLSRGRKLFKGVCFTFSTFLI